MKNKKHLIITSPRSGSSNYLAYVRNQYVLNWIGELDTDVIRGREGKPLQAVPIEDNIEIKSKMENWNHKRGAVAKLFPASIEARFLDSFNLNLKELKEDYYYEFLRTADVIHFLQRDDLDAQILSNYFLRTQSIGEHEIKDYKILQLVTRDTLIQRAMVRYYKEYIREINHTAEIVNVNTEDLKKVFADSIIIEKLKPNIRKHQYVNKVGDAPGSGRELYTMLHEMIEENKEDILNNLSHKPWSVFIEN